MSQTNLDTNKAQSLTLKIGIAGLALFALALVFPQARAQAFQSYILGYAFCMSLALGSFSILLLQNVTGGRWGISIRRLLEAASGTIPYMAILFIPVVLGARYIYPWATPEAAHDHIVQMKVAYLNLPAFVLRAVIYFAIWSLMVHRLLKWSRAEDAGTDPNVNNKFIRLSAPGLVVYALTLTFASLDWLMSIEPHWFSTMYGVRFGAGAALGALSLSVLVLSRLQHIAPMTSVVRSRLSSDLGNLMLAFTMFWAYVTFSEYLIVWSANLPEERFWFSDRMHGGWQFIGISLILLHFFVPFFFLISRNIKKHLNRLARVAMFLLVMRYVDLLWITAPSYHDKLHLHLLDVVTVAGLLGIWFTLYLKELSRRPLVAMNSPRVKQILETAGDEHHG
ncbi:MAG: hypothetical protein O3C57_04975 [Verrucomicrobia bacterium]|nr:hypothetical protein [Verrucomicrobiota bacterium]